MTASALEALQRALLAQLSPLTGARATGTATVTALSGGGDMTLQPNSYLAAVVDGQLRPMVLFKVAPNPATAVGSIANGTFTGGSWTVPDGSTAVVSVVSNLGGAQNNLPAGTTLRFLPELAGLEPLAELATATTGGVGGGVLRRVCLWEALSAPDAATQFFQAGAGEFPALMLAWEQSTPFQGRTTGGDQGPTRKGRKARAFREFFRIFISSGSNRDHYSRRVAGEVALLDASAMLTDRQLNIDCEHLSQVGGGVEIMVRRLLSATRASYLYELQFACNSLLVPTETRTYSDLARIELNLRLPGRTAPEPTDPFDLVSGVIIEP